MATLLLSLSARICFVYATNVNRIIPTFAKPRQPTHIPSTTKKNKDKFPTKPLYPTLGNTKSTQSLPLSVSPRPMRQTTSNLSNRFNFHSQRAHTALGHKTPEMTSTLRPLDPTAERNKRRKRAPSAGTRAQHTCKCAPRLKKKFFFFSKPGSINQKERYFSTKQGPLASEFN